MKSIEELQNEIEILESNLYALKQEKKRYHIKYNV